MIGTMLRQACRLAGNAVKVFAVAATAMAGAAALAPPAAAGAMIETPLLKSLVKTGHYPPVDERVPQIPKVIDLPAQGRENGRHGGRIRMLMGREKDIRMAVYYGYSRLIGYNSKLELEADILRSFEVREGREFTFHLRPVHKWSDGHPFTAEDFRFFWEDIATDKAVSGGGPHRHLLVNDKPPRFEVIDELTVRYTWDEPNAYFLPSIAGTRALYIYAPSHYLKKFHAKYGDKKKLGKKWAKTFSKRTRQFQPADPYMPTLEAWKLQTEPPSSLYVFARNPFFHRVDTMGRQLPYADSMTIAVGSGSLIVPRQHSRDVLKRIGSGGF